jgi:hypothetical protein
VVARKSNTFWARAARLHAHLFGEERVDVGFEDQWIDNSSMADRDPTLTVDKNGQRQIALQTFQDGKVSWVQSELTDLEVLHELVPS